MWIELHIKDDEPRLFNTDNICAVMTDGDGITEIWINGATCFDVRESVAEIKEMIWRGNRHEDR